MPSVLRPRKKAPISTSGPVDYSQSVGSSLKRERVSVLAPLSHAQSFDNPQASSTKIRSGFVTQPGSLIGGARTKPKATSRKKGFSDKLSAALSRRFAPKEESARTRNAALIQHLGLTQAPKGLWPKKDTRAIHAAAIDRLAEQRRAEALSRPWGPGVTKEMQEKIAADRDPGGKHGFGKRKKGRHRKK